MVYGFGGVTLTGCEIVNPTEARVYRTGIFFEGEEEIDYVLITPEGTFFGKRIVWYLTNNIQGCTLVKSFRKILYVKCNCNGDNCKINIAG